MTGLQSFGQRRLVTQIVQRATSLFGVSVTEIAAVPGAKADGVANDRDACYAFAGTIHVPLGVTIRCNFLPTDDVRKFRGRGKILTRDPWGYEHVFDLALMEDGPKFTAAQRVNQRAKELNPPGLAALTIGLGADSIGAGALGGNYTDAVDVPYDPATGNLSSTNRDHGVAPNGGQWSWFRTFVDTLNVLNGSTDMHPRPCFTGYNAARSGQKLSDGWAYRNFDYGFFLNTAYGNKAPDVYVMGMGVNDAAAMAQPADFEAYLDAFDAIIRKAWGYGCSVVLVSSTWFQDFAALVEQGIKMHLGQVYNKLDIINVGQKMAEAVNDVHRNVITGFHKNSYTGWDLLHPSTDGHQYYGAYAAVQMLPSRVIFARQGDNYVPVHSHNCTVFCGAFDEIAPAGTDVADGWFSPATGWVKYTVPSQNTYFRYLIWVDDEDTELTLVEMKQPVFTNANRAHGISAKWCDTRNANAIQVPIASTGRAAWTGYLVTGVAQLVRGLYVIDLAYDGAPSTVYAPMLQFRKQRYESSMGPVSKQIAVNSTSQLTNNVGVKPITAMSFNGGGPNDGLPDVHRGLANPCSATVHVMAAETSAGVIGFWKPYLGTGIAVVKNGAGTVDVFRVINGLANGGALTTIAGTYTADWQVTFEHGTATCRVRVVDSTGTARSYDLPTVESGGTLGMINTSAATARRVTVTGATMSLGMTGSGVTQF